MSSRDGPVGSERDPLVPFLDVIPYCGVVCCINGCYIKTPGCFGCHSKSVFLCCYESFTCCKISQEPGFNCIFLKCECLGNQIGNCIQCNQQCLCLDSRCSVPDYEERECILNICFITCCYKSFSLCEFCSTIKELEEKVQIKIQNNKKTNDDKEFATVMRHVLESDTQASAPERNPNRDSVGSFLSIESNDSYLRDEEEPEKEFSYKDIKKTSNHSNNSNNNDNSTRHIQEKSHSYQPTTTTNPTPLTNKAVSYHSNYSAQKARRSST